MKDFFKLREGLVKVTDVEFDYRDQLPNSPKTSDIGAISSEWKQDRTALRDAVKKMGGLVTNTVAPSRGNKWVGTVTIGTRDDPKKLDDKSIQKAVKSHGIEIHSNQFRESTDLEEVKVKDFFELRESAISKRYEKKDGKPVKESVELDEAVDLMKMSKELLKHKSKGVNYEKAAAYVRAIHNNSNVNVQDKAMKGLLDLLKNMDLTDRTTITKILKDNGFKVRDGKLMRESVDLEEKRRAVTPDQIEKILVKRGNNPKDAKAMVKKHGRYVMDKYWSASPSKMAEVISSLDESKEIDEISTGLLKRARDKASKNTVDARDSASRNTKKYLKDPESGHGIKALKDLDKADKSRRQKKHFDKALKKRSAKESVELEEAKTVKVSRADFDKLKKGSIFDVAWDGAMSAGAAALKVVSKSRSAKYDVEKIKLMPTSGGRSAPFYLYSRKGGDATLAIGDMGASMTKYKIVKESVELEEAAAKVKTTMPDKVTSGAQRFGLKATTKGGHVSIS